MTRPKSLLSAAALFVRLSVAQQSGWIAKQVNSSMCYWDSPRAAVIRDTLYIDGGNLWWAAGLSDGTTAGPYSDGNPLGLVYMLNFSTPFNTTANFNQTPVFTTISKAIGGGNANNIGPNYIDGAMFANDDEWYTYGGMYQTTSAYSPQADNIVATYQNYQYGPPRDQFRAGYALQTLPAGITRYLTNGAAVSIPSENLGYYMGGLKAPSSGLITYQPGAKNDSMRASVNSNTLIGIDFSVQGQETWTNATLPTSVPGRANAELVWVPVGTRGVLVAIGGVITPASSLITSKTNDSQTVASKAVSPGFMTTVSVYDIDTKTWYEQNTTGTPPGQLTQGCTVLASAQDQSSHNIYWYGGNNGLELSQGKDYSDDVWVLSIPTFTWVKVKSGTSTHARAGHKCAKPYPDQMIVVGGYTILSGTGLPCLEGGIIQVFNLSSALWQDTYSPENWSDYQVPASVLAAIGGSATGGSTQTAPATIGFSNTSMTALFGTKYNTTKITKWYPYTPANTTSTTPRTPLLPTAVPKSSGSGTPKYLAPVLGVVLGLIFISLLVLAILLWHRRKYLKPETAGAQSEAGTMDQRGRIATWLRATPIPVVDHKAPTVTTDDAPLTPGDQEEEQAYVVPEMGGSQVLEMEDTSRPIELSGTGFVPLTSKALHSKSGLAHSPSTGSQYSHASEVSRDSSSIRPGVSPVATPRAISPEAGAVIGELPAREKSYSGISNVSESERGHLRGISETSVSTDGGGVYATPMGIPTPAPLGRVEEQPKGLGLEHEGDTLVAGEEHRAGVVSPLTPVGGVHQGGDYIGNIGGSGLGVPGSMSSSPSVKRKSHFEENLKEDER